MPFWNCIIVVTETLFHTLKRRNFPSFLKRFTLGNVIEFYENHERFFFKKALISCFLVTSGVFIQTVKFWQYSRNWAKTKTDSSYLDSLCSVFWGECVYHLSSVAPLITEVVVPDSGPGKPPSQLLSAASQPLRWLFLLKLQILPNFSTPLKTWYPRLWAI